MGCTDLGARHSPGQPALRYVAALRADLGPAVEFATTQGTVRAMFPIVGGAVVGEINGKILPGGADFANRLPDGSYAIEARYCIELEGGVVVFITNAGCMVPQPDGSYHGRTRAVFEVPAGRYGWLGDAVFFGTAVAEAGDEDHVYIELWQTVMP